MKTIKLHTEWFQELAQDVLEIHEFVALMEQRGRIELKETYDSGVDKLSDCFYMSKEVVEKEHIKETEELSDTKHKMETVMDGLSGPELVKHIDELDKIDLKYMQLEIELARYKLYYDKFMYMLGRYKDKVKTEVEARGE